MTVNQLTFVNKCCTKTYKCPQMQMYSLEYTCKYLSINLYTVDTKSPV